jgi:hypothetical protein
MNEPQSTKPSTGDTTALHLDKIIEPAKVESLEADESATAFIAKAAAETVREHPTPVVMPKDASALPAESMLGVVSYCYSKGVYGSNDIGRKMAQDPAVRATCGNGVPRPEDIRRFRRLNREAIQKTLEKFFRHARYKLSEAWAPSNPFRPKPGQSPTSVTTPFRKEETKVYAKREASERIDKATFIDGMSM